jgi:hypothetical protein
VRLPSVSRAFTALLLIVLLAVLAGTLYAAGPTLTAGGPPTGFVSAGAMRVKGSPGPDVYLGVNDLGVGTNRVQVDAGNPLPAGTYGFTFAYDQPNNKLTLQIPDVGLEWPLSNEPAPACEPAKWNAMHIFLRDNRTEGGLALKNVMLDTNALGDLGTADIAGTPGDQRWTVTDYDFSQAFALTGDLDVAGTFNANENMKVEINVGCVPPFTLRVQKYNDLNKDGMRDDNEPFMTGWVINVYDEGGQLVDSQATFEDQYGYIGYVWQIPGGKYTICESLQNQGGWENTQAGYQKPGTQDGNEVCTDQMTFEPGSDWTILFGNYRDPILRVRKYNDLNNSGTRDDGEPWLPGWTIKVYDDQDVLVDAQQTDADGWYVWNVPPGTYYACEVPQGGWMNTQAGNLKPGTLKNGEYCSQSQTLASGDDWTFLFGNYEEPPRSACPEGEGDYALTSIVGSGMGNGRQMQLQKKVVIPGTDPVIDLYGQLAGKFWGVKKVRFIYPDKSFLELLPPPTSPAFTSGAIFWYGADLDENEVATQRYISGKWYLTAKHNKPPRAFVLYPTVQTTEKYANVLTLFGDSASNSVYWVPPWLPEQVQTLTIPKTQVPVDLTVQVAVVDVDGDGRSVDVEIEAGGSVYTTTLNAPANGKLLNIVTATLVDVPAGTDKVTIKLKSPANTGDSAAMIGATANYACTLRDE